jgi:hypothetical protein
VQCHVPGATSTCAQRKGARRRRALLRRLAAPLSGSALRRCRSYNALYDTRLLFTARIQRVSPQRAASAGRCCAWLLCRAAASVRGVRHVRRRASKGAEDRALGHASPWSLRPEGQGPEQAGPPQQGGLQTAAHLRCLPCLASAHLTRLAPLPAQGNQSNAASARRSIDACAQVRRTQLS